jgi:tetratricopeptide (TPR) repeat protein
MAGLLAVGLAGGAAWYVVAPVPPVVHMPEGSDPALMEAVSRARWAVRLHPWSDQAWGRTAMLLQAHALDADAIAYYAQAEHRNPAEPRWPYLHSALVAGADGPQAIELLRRAAQLCDTQPEARPMCLLRLGDVCLESGRLEEAQQAYAAVLGQRPDHPRAHLGLARLAVRRGEVAAALPHLRACADSPEVHKEAHLLLAEVHQRQGDARAAAQAAQAAEGLKDAPQADPWVDEVRALLVGRSGSLRRMVELQGQKRLDEARALEERTTLENYPDIGYLEVGKGRLRQRRWAEAEQVIRQSLRLNDNSATAHFLLGRSLFEQRRFGPAADSFRRATELDVKYAPAYREWGRCAAAVGHNAEAIRHLREALKYAPQDADAHRELAGVLAAEGDRAGAQRHRDYAAQLGAGAPGPAAPQPGQATQPRPGP